MMPNITIPEVASLRRMDIPYYFSTFYIVFVLFLLIEKCYSGLKNIFCR